MEIHCLKNMITNDKCYGDSLFEERDQDWKMLSIFWSGMNIHCLKKKVIMSDKTLVSFEDYGDSWFEGD